VWWTRGARVERLRLGAVGSTVDPFDVPGPDSQAAAAGGCREHGTPQGGSLGATRRIEATASRVETTALLAELLRATPYEVMARVAYLTQGKLHPDFEGVEIGVAEKPYRGQFFLSFDTLTAETRISGQVRARSALSKNT